MQELPKVVDTHGWHWKPYSVGIKDFWIGQDPVGRKWMTKLRGAERAYREIVFARLAQAMNWSCQSSIFIALDEESMALLKPECGRFHAAHFFLEEHQYSPCGIECPLAEGFPRNKHVEEVLKTKIARLIDWPKAELAVYLFGGSEPPEKFFTPSHEFVMIDNELMFAQGPERFDTSEWWETAAGKHLAFQICQEFLALPDAVVKQALEATEFVDREMSDWVASCLADSKRFAARFCAQHKWLRP
ncbi:MAG: hypothetical protein WAW39_30670 [Prosthecobacter sp.]|uniref:hypothetical protein n=1 Tax=Prosthecobacter sp. TaxID=1965333 RepID=UPI003BAE3CAF